jgi:site-specific DNA-adenine methylase
LAPLKFHAAGKAFPDCGRKSIVIIYKYLLFILNINWHLVCKIDSLINNTSNLYNMQHQNAFSYSFSNLDSSRERKTKTDRKQQKRKKSVDYIDSLYLPKTQNKKD